LIIIPSNTSLLSELVKFYNHAFCIEIKADFIVVVVVYDKDYGDDDDFFYRATAMLSAVYAVIVCLSVCHTLVLYQNG